MQVTNRPLFFDHLLLESFFFCIFSAMAVYARSPSAYAALRNLEIMQLPCEKQVKTKMNANNTECGIDEKAIQQEITKYEEFAAIQQEKKKPKPMKTGVVIFDETKVQSKIMFMTGSKVMGFAISPCSGLVTSLAAPAKSRSRYLYLFFLVVFFSIECATGCY